jgi:hypothetical protein
MKLIHIYILIFLVSISYSVKAADEPAYLKYRSDFVQQKYSKALIGFAFERKCEFLSKPLQIDYERNLNSATEVFKGYLLAMKMIQNSTDASNYVKEMVLGTIRYSKKSSCDAVATERTNVGFDTAENFLSLIDNELRKGVGE